MKKKIRMESENKKKKFWDMEECGNMTILKNYTVLKLNRREISIQKLI